MNVTTSNVARADWPKDSSFWGGAAPAPDGVFARVLGHYLGQASAQQTVADQAVLGLATGQTEEVHQVMLAVAKADLTFRTILEVRNRLTEAYQEVMRMQV